VNNFEYGQLVELVNKRHNVKYGIIIGDGQKVFGSDDWRYRIMWPGTKFLNLSNIYASEVKLSALVYPPEITDKLLTQYHTQKY